MTEESSPKPSSPLPPSSLSYTRRKRPNTAGCAVTLLFALLISAVVIVVGLFLPPVNLYQRLTGPQSVPLDAVNNAVALDGLTLIAEPSAPIEGFSVALTALSESAATAADAPEWARSALAVLPPYLAPVGTLYDIRTEGHTAAPLTLQLTVPEIISDITLFDVYGYDTQIGRWRFYPSQPTDAGTLAISLNEVNPLPNHVLLTQAIGVDPQVIIPVDITQALTEDAARIASIVAPAGLSPSPSGQLIGSLAPGFVTNSTYAVMPLIRNFNDPRAVDVQTVVNLISTPGGRVAHAQQLAAVALSSGFEGVLIDYRDLPDSSRADLDAFASVLDDQFALDGLRFGFIVPNAQNSGGAWQTGAYDWQHLGALADYLLIDMPRDPRAFAVGEDQPVEALLRWATREVSRYKLVVGFSARSQRETASDFSGVGYQAALSRLGSVELSAERSATGSVEPGQRILARLDGLAAAPGLESSVRAPFILYKNADGSAAEKIWLMTADALQFRLESLARFLPGGVSISDMVEPDLAVDLAETVLGFKLGIPVESPSGELTLRWRIQDSQGTVSEVITALDADLVVTLEAVEGNFAVNVEVVQGDSAVPRSGAQIAVLRPTATFTPTITPLPSPTPTATPTLAPIIPTQAGGGGFTGPVVVGPAVNPGPGAIVSGFEYGGQVTFTGSDVAAGAMRQAGMTWMKVQIYYQPGNGPDAAGEQVRMAKERGFKVLLSAIGNPNDLASGGGSYIEAYAAWLGGVAGYGPDAIEVWNEPNLDREWPRGQISGGNYVALLSQAYRAIKQSNPGVMVILAAAGPTGAEAAFPGQVVNDDRWLTQVVEAGGLNYADCVGVHYNEGIVPPSQTSGDPRDSFYTRYFWTMTNLYWNITGGQRPLCYTELGYVSPEGYSAPLASNFAWGANTTVAQQAAWLAEVIAIASQSGKVRLLIVWNVDFTRYDGNDPQGGYAIIRPGGGCPACAAIAGAR